MTQEVKDILQGIRTAMEAELTGYEFYKNAARSTSDPKGKETFTRMAEEEMGHFNYLKHQYGHVMDKGAYDFSEKWDKKAHRHAESPIFSPQLRERVKDAHFEVSALTIGMKLEMEAMRYYRSCAEKAASEEVKEFYGELAEWERDHFLAFERELNMLKEEYFQANRFVPM